MYTGLRPGEKLAEELFARDEDVERTAHDKVFRVRNGRGPERALERIEALRAAAEMGDVAGVHRLLGAMVAGYSANGGRPSVASSDQALPPESILPRRSREPAAGA